MGWKGSVSVMIFDVAIGLALGAGLGKRGGLWVGVWMGKLNIEWDVFRQSTTVINRVFFK